MGLKIKKILLNCDFIGFIPSFRILDETRYKSIFSSILSILIIIFSIIFVCYSFAEYVKQNPKVEYYKNNDYSTNKTFLISDSLLMFQYFFICYSDFTIGTRIIVSKTENTNKTNLTLEHCKLGKNINSKHKELIEKYEKIENSKLDDLYCINFNNSNFSLYSHSSIANEYENILQIKFLARKKCTRYLLRFRMVTENDFIDHNQRGNPINPYYQKNDLILYNEERSLVYNYQYIKYESDDGYFFNNKTSFNGIGYYGSNSFDRTDVTEYMLSVEFKMNSFNYDLYRRTFIKFQSFLADVMSLINLLIAISKVITEFLLYKKMHKDIIKYIITNNDIKGNNKGKQIISKKIKLKKIFDIDDSKVQKFEKKINKEQILEENASSKITLNAQNKDFVLNFEKEEQNIIKVMKNLNFISIIKSFFCFKNKKLKLINLRNDVVNKE